MQPVRPWVTRWLYRAVFLGAIPLHVVIRNLYLRLDQVRLMRPRHLGLLAVVMIGSVLLAPIQLYERLRWRRALSNTVVQAPVFIIGHWRSGTTHFHYLMSRTSRFGVVTMLQASFPGIFLTLGPLLERMFPLPDQRPMDQTRWTLDSPQEEEIALSKRVPEAFFSQLTTPQTLSSAMRDMLLRDAEAGALSAWKRAYMDILAKATLASGGRHLLLKNPANTGRIRLLLQLFPDARFVFVHRHPYAVFQSMKRFYVSLFGILALQEVSDALIEETTLSGGELIWQQYLVDRDRIPPGQLVEVGYDDLRRDPLAAVRRVYAELSLPGIEDAVPGIEDYLRETRGYRPASGALERESMELVDQRWGFAFDAFDYARDGD